MFQADFFGIAPESQAAYREMIARTVAVLLGSLPQQPYVGSSPTLLAEQLEGQLCPSQGLPWEALAQQLQLIVGSSIGVWHPATAAHLHTPVLIPALAAEVVLTALNQSMDSFDQAPIATVLEQKLLDWLCQELVGFGAGSGGTFTAGGTQSNYMGLLLARDYFLAEKWGWSALENGLPPEAHKLRFLCSEVAHFSVEKSAMQLGLGTKAVLKIPTDDRYKMRPSALRETILRLKAEGLEPIAIVATAGTTDFGSIDPLSELIPIAREFDIWLHVDAAYGSALLMSDQQRPKLAGIEQADSVTVDFHKAFFQPISCGAFLLRDDFRFNLIRLYADYLNTESREAMGIPDLVTRSVLTTRRFDALKLWFSLQTVGKARFAQMVERLVELAQYVAGEIEKNPHFELLHQPEFGCVVFRYLPANPAQQHEINELVPLRLFNDGWAVMGHTVVKGIAALKLTINNPCVQEAELSNLLDIIRQHCQKYDG